MTLLARREYATAELRHRLFDHGYEPNLVESVLHTLTDKGVLSDARFAEGFVRVRVEKGYGPARIRYELRERGIDEFLSAECLGPYETEWLVRAATVRRKRFGELLPEEQQERARQARYLRHRGFTPAQIWALLDDRLAERRYDK